MLLSVQPSVYPLAHARRKTGDVSKELQVASAELGLAHDALDRHLPPETKQGDVAWAIDQSEVVERKVQHAAQELQEVTELLEKEEAERARLERELAQHKDK